MKTKEKKDDNIPKYYAECGREILPGEAYEHTQTKRRTEVYVHRKCLRRKSHE
ncbi:MAG TPA: hypothetical protein H9761_14840 [Candidatus Eisenbergiella merdavium]|uniref:Uncharacterized protein n=1 Tax=Candidatus Eisenbergiella merdavium TaxID=2838551 RepID=A0A9D2NG96_9FIRM|nr:hypothetical protein [Candidatus Eisenbergiella merdavium]